jgi:hypothetical protein
VITTARDNSRATACSNNVFTKRALAICNLFSTPTTATATAITAATIVRLSLRSWLIHSVIPTVLIAIVIVVAVLRMESGHSIDATNTTRAAHAINSANSTRATHAINSANSTRAANAIYAANSTNAANAIHATNATNSTHTTNTPRFGQAILIHLPRAVAVVPPVAVRIKIIPVVIVPPAAIRHAPTPGLRPRV